MNISFITETSLYTLSLRLRYCISSANVPLEIKDIQMSSSYTDGIASSSLDQ